MVSVVKALSCNDLFSVARATDSLKEVYALSHKYVGNMAVEV